MSESFNPDGRTGGGGGPSTPTPLYHHGGYDFACTSEG